MKHLFFLIALLLFAFGAKAQRVFDIQSSSTDTLKNQTTKTYATNTSGYGTGPAIIDVPYYYSVYCAADSLSGSNAGTAKLQVCNDHTGTDWYTLQTLTIDGTSRSQAFWEGILYARRVRIYFDMPSGTRQVRPVVHAIFKRVY